MLLGIAVPRPIIDSLVKNFIELFRNSYSSQNCPGEPDYKQNKVFDRPANQEKNLARRLDFRVWLAANDITILAPEHVYAYSKLCPDSEKHYFFSLFSRYSEVSEKRMALFHKDSITLSSDHFISATELLQKIFEYGDLKAAVQNMAYLDHILSSQQKSILDFIFTPFDQKFPNNEASESAGDSILNFVCYGHGGLIVNFQGESLPTGRNDVFKYL